MRVCFVEFGGSCTCELAVKCALCEERIREQRLEDVFGYKNKGQIMKELCDGDVAHADAIIAHCVSRGHSRPSLGVVFLLDSFCICSLHVCVSMFACVYVCVFSYDALMLEGMP